MIRHLVDAWYKRLTWVILGTAAGAGWLPAWIFASGHAVDYKLVEGTDCYMDPEFFRDNGVSARQICLSHHVDIKALIFYMTLGAMVPCLTLTLHLVTRWVARPEETAAETVIPPTDEDVPANPISGLVLAPDGYPMYRHGLADAPF